MLVKISNWPGLLYRGCGGTSNAYCGVVPLAQAFGLLGQTIFTAVSLDNLKLGSIYPSSNQSIVYKPTKLLFGSTLSIPRL